MKRPLTALGIFLVGTGCTEVGPNPEASPGGEASVTATAVHPAAEHEADPQERREVTATLQRLFDALETGDADLLRTVLDESVVMHFSETRDGTTSFGSSTVEALAGRIAASEAPLVERMWDPVVFVNGPLATIWTPYDFYVGDSFSHCGIDAASMFRGEEGWKIVALSWTRLQPPACELHPDGPPGA